MHGTSYPTQGNVKVTGRVGPLLQLGAGFHPDLTGYENIFLNASLLGLSREDVDSKLESIIEYSAMDARRVPIQWARIVILGIDGTNSELRRRDFDVYHFQMNEHGQWIVLEP